MNTVVSLELILLIAQFLMLPLSHAEV